MKTALVTGASRGVGRGIAISLDEAGYRVFATGRTISQAKLPSGVIAIPCDHTKDEQTAHVFGEIRKAVGTLDVLVNCAWAGYEGMVEDGVYTWTLPFWEQPMHRWRDMMNAGVRSTFVASSQAAQMMAAQKSGLIVNISYWAARKHIGNVIYGVSKAAVDKMTADMAVELRAHHVAAVALYPGLVRTEAVLAAASQGWLDVANSESPEFVGRVVAALAGDASVLEQSGKVLVAAELARRYGIRDVDGKQPIPLTLETA